MYVLFYLIRFKIKCHKLIIMNVIGVGVCAGLLSSRDALATGHIHPLRLHTGPTIPEQVSGRASVSPAIPPQVHLHGSRTEPEGSGEPPASSPKQKRACQRLTQTQTHRDATGSDKSQLSLPLAASTAHNSPRTSPTADANCLFPRNRILTLSSAAGKSNTAFFGPRQSG